MKYSVKSSLHEVSLSHQSNYSILDIWIILRNCVNNKKSQEKKAGRRWGQDDRMKVVLEYDSLCRSKLAQFLKNEVTSLTVFWLCYFLAAELSK